jgi:hypothetical protein
VDGIEDMDKQYTFEDTNIVAFLIMRGHKIKPWRCTDGMRVAFDIEGDVSTDLEMYYSNVQVGIQDFVKNLKMVKSCIANMKSFGRNRPRRLDTVYGAEFGGESGPG